MKFGTRHIAGAVASVVVLALLYRGYSVYYASPRDALLDAISSNQAGLKRYDGDKAGMKRLEERRQAIVETTLGGRVDRVEHLFRTRLNEVAVSCGLVESEIEVSSGNPHTIQNPAVKGVSKAWKRLFAEKQDFAVMSGQLQGVGTLDQVLHTVAMLQEQPWAHRVDSISMKPTNGGEAIDFRVGVWTLFLPGEEPTEVAPNVALAPGAELAWAGIVAKNAFRMPPPDALVVVVEQAAETDSASGNPSAPPPAFGEWKLVGVWNGANAMGVILANTRTGSARSLSPGEGVLGVKLVFATGERAEFEYQGKRFEVLQKQTLAERRELNQPRG